jgi:hypothetical protein
MTDREESDQLPEEGPGGQVVDDDGRAGAREDADDSAGHPGEEERATGSQPDERDDDQAG